MRKVCICVCLITSVFALSVLGCTVSARPVAQEVIAPDEDFTVWQELPTETLPEPETEPTEPEKRYTDADVLCIAQTVYGEARGLCTAEKRLVVWCVLNRVDDGRFGDGIAAVVNKNQFFGYIQSYQPTDQELAIVRSVLDEWSSGCTPDVLSPYATAADYLYFYGDGYHNWFRADY